MLNETTINVMNALKLHGMAKGFELRLGDSKQAGLSHAEFTAFFGPKLPPCRTKVATLSD